MDNAQETCREAVLAIFPDICLDYLNRLAGENQYAHDSIVSQILDDVENGMPYPKRARAALKRKRLDSDDDEDEVEEHIKKFDNPARRLEPKNDTYHKLAKKLTLHEFPMISPADALRVLEENDRCLFPAFLALRKSIDEQNISLVEKRRETRSNTAWQNINLADTIANTKSRTEKGILEELQAARAAMKAQSSKAAAERQKVQDELDNLEQAKTDGSMSECQCCCEDAPLNRMVHCNGKTLHWFCLACAKKMAETEIGQSKYQLTCMSMDGCQAGFDQCQRELFLDANTSIALDRIEQEAILRMAGIENLETCPFCPFAAEYPPVDEYKEFRCQNPECERISCRLCRLETHVPKSCQEAAKETGHSGRRAIEEAMSAALIRTCNKCKCNRICVMSTSVLTSFPT
jgi:TRIAD3 protein (E3 ubiquitin-protein ligase RNF216)